MRNLLSIDVEEYFQVEGFADVVDRKAWDAYESRVEAQTRRLLDILDASRAKATFFVLAWTAERIPGIVTEIVRRGHELASHGYAHRMIDTQTEAEFRADVRRAKEILEGISGVRVTGYRAPSFSITERTPWAHRVLAEEGHLYSSSVFPVRHDRYGIPDAPRTPWQVRPAGAQSDLSIVEVPPLTLRMLGQNLPVAGGGYMRLFPVALVSRAISRMNDAGHPGVVYLHPWEIDPAQPRIHGRPLNRFRHYVGLERLEAKLTDLLDRHAFTTIASHLGIESRPAGAGGPGGSVAATVTIPASRPGTLEAAAG